MTKKTGERMMDTKMERGRERVRERDYIILNDPVRRVGGVTRKLSSHK